MGNKKTGQGRPESLFWGLKKLKIIKNNQNLTFLVIKTVQFHSSANLFVQLLEPDMGILFENRSEG